MKGLDYNTENAGTEQSMIEKVTSARDCNRFARKYLWSGRATN